MTRAFKNVSFLHQVDRSLLVPEPREDLCRLGSAHDGGYVVSLETIMQAKQLLSFGVADNWDFERDVVALNPALTVDAFDPSVGPRRFATMALRSAISAVLRLGTANVRGAVASARRVRTGIDYFRFFSGTSRHTPRRIWYNSDRDSVAIVDLLARVRSSRRVPAFAKIDIEGSEYRILPWIIDAADSFTGLVVEFHDTDICANIFNAQIAKLLRRFVIVHVHGNNFGDLAVDGSLPLTLEITFVHRGIAPRAVSAAAVGRPAGLDAPNDPRREDYVLNFTAPESVGHSVAARGSSS
jgi:hypothetical protein